MSLNVDAIAGSSYQAFFNGAARISCMPCLACATCTWPNKDRGPLIHSLVPVPKKTDRGKELPGPAF